MKYREIFHGDYTSGLKFWSLLAWSNMKIYSDADHSSFLLQLSEQAKASQEKFQKMKDIYSKLRDEHVILLRNVIFPFSLFFFFFKFHKSMSWYYAVLGFWLFFFSCQVTRHLSCTNHFFLGCNKGLRVFFFKITNLENMISNLIASNYGRTLFHEDFLSLQASHMYLSM